MTDPISEQFIGVNLAYRQNKIEISNNYYANSETIARHDRALMDSGLFDQTQLTQFQAIKKQRVANILDALFDKKPAMEKFIQELIFETKLLEQFNLLRNLLVKYDKDSLLYAPADQIYKQTKSYLTATFKNPLNTKKHSAYEALTICLTDAFEVMTIPTFENRDKLALSTQALEKHGNNFLLNHGKIIGALQWLVGIATLCFGVYLCSAFTTSPDPEIAKTIGAIFFSYLSCFLFLDGSVKLMDPNEPTLLVSKVCQGFFNLNKEVGVESKVPLREPSLGVGIP